MAEGFVRCAVEVGQGLRPLFPDLLKDVWRNGELGAACVDDGRVRGVFSWLLHWLRPIVHALSLKSPCSQPVLEVLECLEAFSAANNLCGVVTTEESVGSFAHFPGRNTEAHNGFVDNAIVLERPEVVELLLLHVLVWGEPEDSIRIVAESLRLVECEELEERALVGLKVLLKSLVVTATAFKRLNTGKILPDEPLKLGRSVRQLARCLR